MQRLEVSGGVRPIYGSLGVKRLTSGDKQRTYRKCYGPRTVTKFLLFWHIPIVNLLHFLIMFGYVTNVQNYWVLQNKSRDKWVPVTTARRVLRLRVKERPPVRRVAVNILNEQSRTADKVWSSSLGVGRGANNSSQ